MKRNLQLCAIMMLGVLMLTSCVGTNKSKKEVTPYPATVANVTIQKKPKTVASLSPSITQLLIELGYKEKIAGYSSDTKIEGIAKEKLIGTGLKPDLESIGKVAPEIIFTNVPLTKVQMSKVSDIGIKVVVIPTVKNIDELKLRYTELITAMEGNIKASTNGKVISDSITQKLDYITSKLPAKKPTFLYVASLDPIIATGDTFESSLLSKMGDNLASGYKQYNVTKEQATKLNPDIIFFASPLEAEHIKQSEIFKNSNAVKQNKLFVIDGTLITLQSKNVDDVLRTVVSKVYPTTDFKQPALASSQPEKKKKKFFFF